MSYDEALAERVRRLLADRDDVEPKKMFGGLAFMVGGHMAVGILGSDLMVRVGPAAHADALARPHARPMDFTGTPSKSMVYVEPEGTRALGALRAWVLRGLAYADSLPPKQKPKQRAAKRPTKKKSRDAKRPGRRQ